MAKNKGLGKSPAKEQSLRDYAGMISVYAVIVTIILVIMGLKEWFGIDLLKMIGDMFSKVGAQV